MHIACLCCNGQMAHLTHNVEQVVLEALTSLFIHLLHFMGLIIMYLQNRIVGLMSSESSDILSLSG